MNSKVERSLRGDAPGARRQPGDVCLAIAANASCSPLTEEMFLFSAVAVHFYCHSFTACMSDICPCTDTIRTLSDRLMTGWISAIDDCF